jgi:hypothetical protein
MNAARAGSLIALLALWTACFGGTAASAHAEVRVSGETDAVMIETQQATLDDVLGALQHSFKFRYRSSGALSGVITGTYSGSLSRVVSRLLEGQSYVLQRSQDHLEAIIFGPKEPARATGSAPAWAGNRAAAGVPPAQQGAPVKECKYQLGEQWIPVEC